jgi:outer membrane lipoprotein SlyB
MEANPKTTIGAVGGATTGGLIAAAAENGTGHHLGANSLICLRGDSNSWREVPEGEAP